MLIDQFIAFLSEASQLPYIMWRHNYILARRSFNFDLKNLRQGLAGNTVSVKKLDTFIELLKDENPDELKLAEGFILLGEIFEKAKIKDERFDIYKELNAKFLKRARRDKSFKELRDSLKKKRNPAEADRELYRNEGLNYCLLYYLTYYKTLTGLKTAREKNAFINQNEINFGLGSLPGLRPDFEKDEVLEKFILFILNDELRQELLWAYYEAKRSIVGARYYTAVECALHNLIRDLLEIFNKENIDSIASDFYAPYGKKASIKKFLPIFRKEYVPE